MDTFSVSLAFHQVAENLVLQILGLLIFTNFCSWRSRFYPWFFTKIQILVINLFYFGYCGLGYFGFGILE